MKERYFVVECCIENRAFNDENINFELHRLFSLVAEKCEEGNFNFKLMDINGNSCLTAKIEER